MLASSVFTPRHRAVLKMKPARNKTTRQLLQHLVAKNEQVYGQTLFKMEQKDALRLNEVQEHDEPEETPPSCPRQAKLPVRANLSTCSDRQNTLRKS